MWLAISMNLPLQWHTMWPGVPANLSLKWCISWTPLPGPPPHHSRQNGVIRLQVSRTMSISTVSTNCNNQWSAAASLLKWNYEEACLHGMWLYNKKACTLTFQVASHESSLSNIMACLSSHLRYMQVYQQWLTKTNTAWTVFHHIYCTCMYYIHRSYWHCTDCPISSHLLYMYYIHRSSWHCIDCPISSHLYIDQHWHLSNVSCYSEMVLLFIVSIFTRLQAPTGGGAGVEIRGGVGADKSQTLSDYTLSIIIHHEMWTELH